MTYADALRRLKSMTASDQDPVLTDAELADLLQEARTPDVYDVWADAYLPWAATHAYAVGDVLVPSVRNGHFYEVTITDGMSGAAEPVFPTTEGGTIAADGVTYAEAGVAPWAGEWSLNRAASAGWKIKAGKAAGRFDFSSDVNDFSRSQIVKACLEMAKQYASGAIVSIEVGSSVIYDPVIGNVNPAP